LFEALLWHFRFWLAAIGALGRWDGGKRIGQNGCRAFAETGWFMHRMVKVLINFHICKQSVSAFLLLAMNKLRVVVWGENVHEQTHAAVRKLYPDGMHNAIAAGLRELGGAQVEVSTATLQEADHGLTEERLAATDVLTWWGHCAHGKVEERIVDRVQKRVLEGMGLIVLHSGHYSKIFKRLMGTTCSLTWREADDRERIWVCNPGHPIAEGLGPYFEIPAEEMYGEPFGIPAPEEQVFISWFEGGEVFRSGCCYTRGAGKIFYFRPGHETYPTYFQAEVKRVIWNSVRWAAPRMPAWVDQCPNMPPVEKISKKDTGERLHKPGEAGLR
jgi:trehalose utilization protein